MTGWVLGASTNALLGRTLEVVLDPAEPLKLRFTLAFSPSRVGKAAKNRKNWLPVGRESEKGGR